MGRPNDDHISAIIETINHCVLRLQAMGLEEEAWDEYLADAPSSSASCEQNKPSPERAERQDRAPPLYPVGLQLRQFPLR